MSPRDRSASSFDLEERHVFVPLTFVTGFFGMNFGWMVDRVDSPVAFWLLGFIVPIATAARLALLVRPFLIGGDRGASLIAAGARPATIRCRSRSACLRHPAEDPHRLVGGFLVDLDVVPVRLDARGRYEVALPAAGCVLGDGAVQRTEQRA